MFKQYVELSDHQDFPQSSRNHDRKNGLRRTKNTPQVQNFKEKGSANFPMVPRTLKTDFGSSVKYACENRQKIRKKAPKIWRVFLPDNRLRKQSLPDSQRVDLRARVRWKDDDSSYDVQFSVSRWFLPFGRNLAGKARKNSSGTPTSGSHNSPIRTLICANFITLESRRRKLSGDILHDPFWATEGLKNWKVPPKIGSEKGTRTKTEEDSVEGSCGR